MLKAPAVARLLGISPRKVYDLAKAGRLPSHRIDRAVVFDAQDVEAFRASCRSAGIPATSAGATSSTATFKAHASGLLDCFRAAGVAPRLTPSTAPKAVGSTPLRLASSRPAIGPSAIVGGVKTDMVVWADNEVFLQLWIGADDHLPRRIRAQFRADPRGLRHDLELSNWQLDAALPADTFSTAKARAGQPMAFAAPGRKLPIGVKPLAIERGTKPKTQ